MKKYVIYNREQGRENGLMYSGYDLEEVQEMLLDQINDHNAEMEDDDDKVSLFDYVFAVEEEKDVNEFITDYLTARDFLGGKPNNDYAVSHKVMSNNSLRLEDVTKLVQALNPSHVKALIAMNELFTIAQAWNKADNFVPDFSDRTQDKWFPWFVYDEANAGFVCANTINTPANTSAYIGSRLCFKSSNRACQFGEQFIDLFNQVFLLNK